MSANVEADNQAAPIVALVGIKKRFGNFIAVNDLNLEIGQGEFFTLLGPSGCGKTTTLRMIAGFETPDAGSVLIDGVDQVGVSPDKRPTNTVFQSYALFPHLSVRENVAYGLKRRRVKSAEVKRRVQTELERVGLWGEANRRPNQLSGGQQQRVALARAVVNLPKVLLLDEPLGALDLKLRKSLQVELKRIQREVGISFVYVTHDQEEALTMSDRIAVMNRGVVEQVAGPEEVYERPATDFVAGFIGVSNLMAGTVSSAVSGRTTVKLAAGLEIETTAQGFAAGERCHAIVRPEKLLIEAAASPTNARPGLSGTVISSLYLGSATQIAVELDGTASTMTVLVANSDAAASAGLPGGGARVRLSWAPEQVHLVRESAAIRGLGQ